MASLADLKLRTAHAPLRVGTAVATLVTLSGAQVPPPPNQEVALPTESTGCLVYGQSVRPKLGAEIWNVESRMHCQARCQQDPDCGRFRYHEDTKGCQLAPKDSWYINDHHCMSAFGAKRCVAGPRECPLIPDWCNEVPDADKFPAETQLDTNTAFSTGLQPPNMQCWPNGENEWPRLCNEEPITVLEDSQTGWSGLCQGLHKIDNIPRGKTCADVCKEDLWCSEWALVKNANNEEQCWAGLGDRCYKNHGYEGQLVHAQRIMHGHFRVLRDLKYAEVDGLVHVDVTNEKGMATTADLDGTTRCKNTCLSLVNCQIWIYHKSSGCWIEWPLKHRIKYPATKQSWGIGGSTDVVAGQYLQRVCGNLSGDVQASPVVPSTTPVPVPPTPAVSVLPTLCEPNNTLQLTAACQCASNVDSEECMMGQYCWEGNSCSNWPKPPGRTIPDDNTDGLGDDGEEEFGVTDSHVNDIIRMTMLVLMCLVCCGTASIGWVCMKGKGRDSGVRELEEDNYDERDADDSSPASEDFKRVQPTHADFVSRSVPLVMAPPPPAPVVAYTNYPRAAAQQAYMPVATSSASRGMVEVPAGTPGAMPMMENRNGGLVALPTLRLGGASPARMMNDPGPPTVCRYCGNVFMKDSTFCRKCGEPRSVFDMMDTNHDGFVTKEEWDRFGMGP